MVIIKMKENLNDLKRYLIPKIVRMLRFVLLFYFISHIILLGLFASNKIVLMSIVNVISIVIYGVLCYQITKLSNANKKNLIDNVSLFVRLCNITIIELYLHMVLAIISVGWKPNFQIYNFSIVGFIMLSMYVSNSIIKSYIELGILGCSYVALRVFTLCYGSIYKGLDKYANILDILNTILTLLLTGFIIISLSKIILEFEKNLAKKATYDRLTGLVNRRYLDTLTYSKTKSCIAILDIDSFKSINDTYGHETGDEVLKKLSDVLKAYEIKYNVKAIRWGGEEFVIVDENEDYKGFTRILEELRNEIEHALIVSDDYAINYTITIGVAYYKEAPTYKELLSLADARLYVGKNNGKNKVVTKNAEI